MLTSRKIFFVISLLALICLSGYSETNGINVLSSDKDQETTKSNNIQLAMSSNDYIVTAGDVYTLAFIAGSSSINYGIAVDTSYKIRVANLAVIDVEGMTFLQLKKQVEEIITKNYPMSGVQFVMLTPAVFKVTLKGEVKKTEVKEAWALSRLSSIINNSMTDYSSIRNVVVTSVSGKKKSYDLFKAERFGDLSQDPYLRPDDVITINRISRKIKISGEVERPGTYILNEGENLKTLIEYYGNGLTGTADISKIEVKRVINQQNNAGTKFYLTKKEIDEDFSLVTKDEIHIPSLTELSPIVFFEGALYSSGSTQPVTDTRIPIKYTEGELYTSVIRRNNSMFSSLTDLEHAFIIRGTEFIPIQADKILYDMTYSCKEKVENHDVLFIPFKQYFVSVAGAVQIPGRYPYIPERDWSYYIGLAGGFSNQNSFDTIKIVDIEGKVHKKTDVITPETTITAKRNSFLYNFNQYAPVISSILSIIISGLTVYSVLRN